MRCFSTFFSFCFSSIRQCLLVVLVLPFFISSCQEQGKESADQQKKETVSPENTTNTESNKKTKLNHNSMKSKPTPTPKTAINSKQLAEEYGFEEVIDHSNRKYQLLAVIEGEDANKKLNYGLSNLAKQQHLLSKLRTQFSQLPKESLQQRELIAGRINSIATQEKQQLNYLEKNYAFSTKKHYILIPSKVAIVKADTEKKGKTVHLFETHKDYLQFQQTRSACARRFKELVEIWKQEQVAAIKQEQKKQAKEETGTKKQKIELNLDDATLAKIKQDPELQRHEEGLKTNYQFDPQKKYHIRFLKSGFYVRIKSK